MASFASTDIKEYQLPESIRRPSSVAASGDGVLWVAGTTGLFRVSPQGGLKSQVQVGICCVDVVTWTRDRMVSLFGIGPPKGPGARIVVKVFGLDEKLIFEAEIPPEYGRARKIAISDSGWAFLTTKHESPQLRQYVPSGGQGQPNISSLYRLDLEVPIPMSPKKLTQLNRTV